jgi:hypothetical protein
MVTKQAIKIRKQTRRQAARSTFEAHWFCEHSVGVVEVGQPSGEGSDGEVPRQASENLRPARVVELEIELGCRLAERPRRLSSQSRQGIHIERTLVSATTEPDLFPVEDLAAIAAAHPDRRVGSAGRPGARPSMQADPRVPGLVAFQQEAGVPRNAPTSLSDSAW